MEKKLTFAVAHNLNKIAEELFVAFPSFIVDTPGALFPKRSLAGITGDGKVLVLWVPKDTDEAQVAAVVAAHDPTPPAPKPSAKDLARVEIRSANTLPELKAAVEKILDL